MAKAGFWLRGAKGKLAGATIYKGADGTVMREVVKPKNPKTSKQLYQRAIIATVMRYYALGKEIFNHSFEGYGVGAPSMARFQSVNAKRLRALIAADLANDTTKARVVAPGITAAVANPLIASMGTYSQQFLTHDDQGNVTFPAPQADETIADYALRCGLIDDDIYTIVVIGESATDFSYEYITVDGQFIEQASVAASTFNYVQLRVKAGTQTSDTAITTATPLTDVFDVVFKSAAQDVYNFTFGEGFLFTDITNNPDYVSGAIAIIRSREDSGLRSNSVFEMIGTQNKGVTAPWILQVWRGGSSVGNSDLILEGADFAPAEGPTGLPDITSLADGYYSIPDALSYGASGSMANAVFELQTSGGVQITPSLVTSADDDSVCIVNDDTLDWWLPLQTSQLNIFLQNAAMWFATHYRLPEGFRVTSISANEVPPIDEYKGSF